MLDRLNGNHVTNISSRSVQVRHPQRIYLERVSDFVHRETRWLDIGCGRQLVPSWMRGHTDLEGEIVSRARCLVGIDPDLVALQDNHSHHFKLKADGESLPFADDSFDLATSNMVFEHVKQPRPILAELRRVLTPGGRLILLTPNWLDVVTIVARVVPNRLHPALVSRMETRGAQDVYPTHFRFNRPSTVQRLLSEAGFGYSKIERLDHPDTYAHVPIVAQIESAWHSLARRWPALKGTLLIEAMVE